jgi:hypothetical protein
MHKTEHAVTFIPVANIRGGGKTIHVVFKCLSRSLLLKGVVASELKPPPYHHHPISHLSLNL